MSHLPRRTFLVASTMGAAGFQFGPSAFGTPSIPAQPRLRPAKSTILFFLCGGASHIDMWDMKPDAPLDYRGPFEAVDTTAPGIQLSEHLPMTAQVADKLAIVRSVSDHGRATGDHHAGYYYNLTGNVPDTTFRTQGNDRRPYPDDWPFMGSVIGSKRPAHPTLPQAITLPHMPSKAPYTRPGQFAGRIGALHNPLYLDGDFNKPLRFSAPSLALQTSESRLRDRQSLLGALNETRREFDNDASVQDFVIQREKAFSLLSSSSTASAFDLTGEPETLRARYGETINGMSLLMARRLVEAEVPFVTVFWKENVALSSKCKSAGGWDTHGNNFNCLRENLLPEFDRAYSALIQDLSDRGLLEDTLVLVSSEMGRKPLIGDRRSGGVSGGGRDHWTACQSVVLAGGGVRGGQTFGTTDARAEYPDEHPLSPTDITRTVYHAMGINDLEITDRDGRPFHVADGGRVLTELF